ncbi:MAG: hypothetical protein ACK4N5_04095, partial [Myxococcales bacterium]
QIVGRESETALLANASRSIELFGELTVSLASQGTLVRVVHEARCPEIGPVCAERPEPPQLHDQRFYLAELRPVVAYTFLSWLSAEAQLPFRVTRTTITYRTLGGTAFTPPYADIHHRDETLTGLADPWLSARFHLRLGGILWVARAGVTLPVGRTEPNPFRLGELGLPHQHVQFGTGTFNPLLGLDAEKRVDDTVFRLWSLARPVLYANRQGFQGATQLSGGVSAGLKVFERLTVALTVDAIHEGPERWDGVVQQDGTLARTDLLAGVAASVELGAWGVSAMLKAPFFQHFETAGDPHGALTYPALVNVTVRRAFDVAGD